MHRLELAAPLVAGAELNREAIAAAARRGHLDATTLMEYLIRRGIAQRTAHGMVGKLVRKALDRGVRLADLSLDEFQRRRALARRKRLRRAGRRAGRRCVHQLRLDRARPGRRATQPLETEARAGLAAALGRRQLLNDLPMRAAAAMQHRLRNLNVLLLCRRQGFGRHCWLVQQCVGVAVSLNRKSGFDRALMAILFGALAVMLATSAPCRAAQAAAEDAAPRGRPRKCAADAMPAEEPGTDAMPEEEPAPADEGIPLDEAPKEEKPRPRGAQARGRAGRDPIRRAQRSGRAGRARIAPHDAGRAVAGDRHPGRLDQAELAKPFVDELAAAKARSGRQGRAGRAQFHSATLIKLAHDPRLGSRAGPVRRRPAQVGRSISPRSAAAGRLGQAAERPRTQRSGPSRLGAGAGPRSGRGAAGGDSGRPKRRPNDHGLAKDVLVELGEYAVAPLLGVLESPDAALKTQVVEVLGRLRAAEAAAPLLAHRDLAGQHSASCGHGRLGARAASAAKCPAGPKQCGCWNMPLGERSPQSRGDSDGPQTPVKSGIGTASGTQSMPIQYDPTGAALAEATRLARELVPARPPAARAAAAVPDRPAASGQVPRRARQAAAKRHGHGLPIAAYFGPRVVEDVLVARHGRWLLRAAARRRPQILGDIGSPALLGRGGASASPLVLAAAKPPIAGCDSPPSARS